ncbi:TonB-dependent receptor [Novosphingobium album (ex Hu et al. 2023)]|uniref:TonB-dependent receptor plug domain-containing protein n=1 Tax=Novosphingobium album (ex Hu et al. 2023) TaxID=2930093 RepID=A0ABT0B5R7_9SPHN|nr:TonB-dependent receptor [Novosphingobium album (ex Hu et al. 2023)]MCJ2180225.1 TonB-dependent receptor plug domain-containing protein [Novosphingobium album (ex Hu et al. 2023)]
MSIITQTRDLHSSQVPNHGEEAMRRLQQAVLCSASVWALAAPAHAEAVAGSSGAAEMETASETTTIVVTARRREEDVQDVPVVVNSVTSDEIAKLNLQNFTEVQTLVPGLQLQVNDNGIGSNAQIRGVAFDINASTQPTVEFYLNDAVANSTLVLQQMYDVAQVDVLRGPQGTLRGRASPSGSITVTTRKPDLYEVGGNLSTSASDIGSLNFNGAVGVPIIEGVLGIRAAGTWSETEGNRVRTINTGLDGRDPFTRSKGGRLTALFEPADWLRFEGMYQRTDTQSRSYSQYASFSLFDSTAAESSLVIKPKDRLSIQETPRTYHQKFDLFNWRAEARFADQVLIYQGAHTKGDIVAQTNSDLANAFEGFDYFQTTHSRTNETTHEVRLQNDSRLFDMFDYVIGYFNWTRHAPTELTLETPVVLPLPPAYGGGVVFVQPTDVLTSGDVKENSVFGNVIAHIGDKVQLSGGLRYINFKSPAGTLTIGSTVLPGAAKVDDNKWIYTASAQYFITPEVMVYASTGSSYRPGPTIVGNFSPIQSDLQRSFTYLDSESSKSYELGLKSTFLDNRLRVNITGYHQTFTNYPYKLTAGVYTQTFTYVASTGSFAAGVGQSAQFAANVPVEVNGVEAEIGFKVTPHFDLGMTASYTKGKIKNGLVPCDDLNGDGVPDNLTSAPTLAEVQAAYGSNYMGACRVSQRSSAQAPFSTTVQASYNVPISDKVDFFTRGLLTFQGKSQGDPTLSFDSIGSYGLLNMFAGIRDPRGAWELNLFAKNLLDTSKATLINAPAVSGYQELQPPTYRTTSGASTTSTYAIINSTPPREFGVNFRYAFGSR